jgi:hypothetical protein
MNRINWVLYDIVFQQHIYLLNINLRFIFIGCGP